jgi:hypothetical protein
MFEPYVTDDQGIRRVLSDSNQFDSDGLCKICNKYKSALYYVGKIIV